MVILEYPRRLVAIDSRGLQRPFRVAALFINRRRARLAQVWRLYSVPSTDQSLARGRCKQPTTTRLPHVLGAHTHPPHRRSPPARGHHWGCRIKKQGGWRWRRWERGRARCARSPWISNRGSRKTRSVSCLWSLLTTMDTLGYVLCYSFPPGPCASGFRVTVDVGVLDDDDEKVLDHRRE